MFLQWNPRAESNKHCISRAWTPAGLLSVDGQRPSVFLECLPAAVRCRVGTGTVAGHGGGTPLEPHRGDASGPVGALEKCPCRSRYPRPSGKRVPTPRDRCSHPLEKSRPPIGKEVTPDATWQPGRAPATPARRRARGRTKPTKQTNNPTNRQTSRRARRQTRREQPAKCTNGTPAASS